MIFHKSLRIIFIFIYNTIQFLLYFMILEITMINKATHLQVKVAIDKGTKQHIILSPTYSLSNCLIGWANHDYCCQSLVKMLFPHCPIRHWCESNWLTEFWIARRSPVPTTYPTSLSVFWGCDCVSKSQGPSTKPFICNFSEE